MRIKLFAALKALPVLIVPALLYAQAKPAKVKYGKYGCTASKYRNGSFEFLPRGSFQLSKDGKYSYSGFEKPSTGKFTVDADGNLLFKGGYLDGGKAEKTDQPNRYLVVFPANPDNRWTCSCTTP
ncbi:MAG TPA: hypothetical protein VIK80_10485 [Flavihumibacter sp.]|jgi:hypothetical protein